MSHISHNPKNVAQPVGGYSHGLEVKKGSRYLFISGQIPEQRDGVVPDSFVEQCEVVWNNIETILESANMCAENLVKVTTFLTDRQQVAENRVVRQRHLGEAKPALTVIVVQTLDPKWLLEIEAIAASED